MAYHFPYPFNEPPQSLPGPPPGKERQVVDILKYTDEGGKFPSWLINAKLRLRRRSPPPESSTLCKNREEQTSKISSGSDADNEGKFSHHCRHLRRDIVEDIYLRRGGGVETNKKRTLRNARRRAFFGNKSSATSTVTNVTEKKENDESSKSCSSSFLCSVEAAAIDNNSKISKSDNNSSYSREEDNSEKVIPPIPPSNNRLDSSVIIVHSSSPPPSPLGNVSSDTSRISLDKNLVIDDDGKDRKTIISVSPTYSVTTQRKEEEVVEVEGGEVEGEGKERITTSPYSLTDVIVEFNKDFGFTQEVSGRGGRGGDVLLEAMTSQTQCVDECSSSYFVTAETGVEDEEENFENEEIEIGVKVGNFVSPLFSLSSPSSSKSSSSFCPPFPSPLASSSMSHPVSSSSPSSSHSPQHHSFSLFRGEVEESSSSSVSSISSSFSSSEFVFPSPSDRKSKISLLPSYYSKAAPLLSSQLPFSLSNSSYESSPSVSISFPSLSLPSHRPPILLSSHIPPSSSSPTFHSFDVHQNNSSISSSLPLLRSRPSASAVAVVTSLIDRRDEREDVFIQKADGCIDEVNKQISQRPMSAPQLLLEKTMTAAAMRTMTAAASVSDVSSFTSLNNNLSLIGESSRMTKMKMMLLPHLSGPQERIPRPSASRLYW